MSLNVKEFIIQAKVIEDEQNQEIDQVEQGEDSFSESVKQEIIDECIAKMKELIERERIRY